MIVDQYFKEKVNASDTKHTSDKPIRSIVKTLSWRALGTIDTIGISWLVTGQIATAFSIGAIELITKMVLYFFHERIWNTVKWGKQKI